MQIGSHILIIRLCNYIVESYIWNDYLIIMERMCKDCLFNQVKNLIVGLPANQGGDT